MDSQSELLSLQKQLSKKADKQAFRKLFEMVSPKLCKFACQYVTIEEAEEVVYLVLTRVWKNRKELHKINNLNTYLYKAVRFEVIKINKRNKRYNLVVLDNETENANQEHFCAPITPDIILAAKELHHFLNEQVENLPPKCRLAFKLVKEDGLKYAAAAEIMGVSKNTIENHVAKAVKQLREAVLAYQKDGHSVNPQEKKYQANVQSLKDKSYKYHSLIFLIFFCI
mgnify:CR=1 FL=1